MPCTVERNTDGSLRHILISCDACGLTLNDEEIKAQGGLLEMGWLRRFNETNRCDDYFCPAHKNADLNGRLRHYCPKHI